MALNVNRARIRTVYDMVRSAFRVEDAGTEEVNPHTINLPELKSRLHFLSEEKVTVLFRETALALVKSVAYNDLRECMVIFRDWAEQRPPLRRKPLGTYLEVYEYCQGNLNGRVTERSPWLVLDDTESSKRYAVNFSRYFSILIANTEYEYARRLVDGMKPQSALHIYKLATALRKKAMRVELDLGPREAFAAHMRQRLSIALSELGISSSLHQIIMDIAANGVAVFASPEAVDQLVRALEHIPEDAQWQISALVSSWVPQVISQFGASAGADFVEKTASVYSSTHMGQVRYHLLAANGRTKEILAMARGNISPWVGYKHLSQMALDRNDFKTAHYYAALSGRPDNSLRRKSLLQSTLARLKFLSETSELLEQVGTSNNPKGYVFLASLNCQNTLAMVGPALVELKNRGFAVGSLMNGILAVKPPKNVPVEIARLYDSISRQRDDGHIELDWQVDWAKREVICEGVNYFEGFYERLSTAFRRLTIDIEHEPIKSLFQNHLRIADYVLRATKRIAAAAETTGAPVVLLGSNSHVTPYSIIRDFCLHSKLDNLRYVQANNAYQNYYTNLSGKLSRSMGVVDMKLHRRCRAPFLATEERFNSWYLKNPRSEAVQARFDNLLAADRSRRAQSKQNDVLGRIQQAKHQGKRVVCCFGKILCDLGVPQDGGPAHVDMKDWINHTISTLAEDPHTLVLIKPHPHELRPEIALELTEYLRDVLPVELPSNVLFLDHADFNVLDLAPYLDVAVLYNGTTCMELTGLGVPVIMASWFGQYDYPLDLNYPKDRADYEILLKAELPVPTEESRWKAMSLLHYMGTSEVAIPNAYSRRPITNDSVGAPTWYRKRLGIFLRRGDPNVSVVADRILEGLRGPGLRRPINS